LHLKPLLQALGAQKLVNRISSKASAKRETVTTCGRIGFKRRKINLSLVSASQKVAVNEVIELRLLLQEVLGRGFRRLQLQCQMHALMPAVLLRMARFYPLDLNAEPQPPDRELAEAEKRIGACERNPIISADHARQTELLERTVKHTEGIRSLVVESASRPL
jgi:hypothetical protein